MVVEIFQFGGLLEAKRNTVGNFVIAKQQEISKVAKSVSLILSFKSLSHLPSAYRSLKPTFRMPPSITISENGITPNSSPGVWPYDLCWALTSVLCARMINTVRPWGRRLSVPVLSGALLWRETPNGATVPETWL